MPSDFFGYSKTTNAVAQVISSEYAAVSIGSGQVSLVQSVQADYQQEIRPVFAVGDTGLYWVSGHSQGTIQFSRMAGKTGFLSAFQGGACGSIDSILISATQGQPCANAGGGGTITFAGGMTQGVQVGMQAGRVEIIEGATIRVAYMSV